MRMVTWFAAKKDGMTISPMVMYVKIVLKKSGTVLLREKQLRSFWMETARRGAVSAELRHLIRLSQI